MELYLDFQTVDLAADFFRSKDRTLLDRVYSAPPIYIDAVSKFIEAQVLSNRVHFPPTKIKSQATADFLGPAIEMEIISPARNIEVDAEVIKSEGKKIAELVLQLAATKATFRTTLIYQGTHEYAKWKHDYDSYYGDPFDTNIILDHSFHNELAESISRAYYATNPEAFDRSEIPGFQVENHSLHFQRAAESKERHKVGYMPPISRSRPEFYVGQVLPARCMTEKMIPTVAYGLLDYMIEWRQFAFHIAWRLWEQSRHRYTRRQGYSRLVRDAASRSSPEGCQRWRRFGRCDYGRGV